MATLTVGQLRTCLAGEDSDSPVRICVENKIFFTRGTGKFAGFKGIFIILGRTQIRRTRKKIIMHKKYFTDAKGRKLTRSTVQEIATNNACASGVGVPGEAMCAYINGQSDADLLQWATDENGNFPDHLTFETT